MERKPDPRLRINSYFTLYTEEILDHAKDPMFFKILKVDYETGIICYAYNLTEGNDVKITVTGYEKGLEYYIKEHLKDDYYILRDNYERIPQKLKDYEIQDDDFKT